MMKYICPHPMLLIGGRLLTLLTYGLPILGIYLLIFGVGDDRISGIYISAIFIPLAILWYIWMSPHIMGDVIITPKSILYYGLFLPIVRLKFDEIQYATIKTFDEGNVVYVSSIDGYKFVLLSTLPFPKKRIDKIRSSRKKQIIKYAVSEKLCRLLVERLPESQTGIFKHQVYLYQKSRRGRRRRSQNDDK